MPLRRHAAGVVTDVAIGALLSSLSRSRAVGVIAWSSKAGLVWGEIAVLTEVAECTSGRLVLRFVEPRPDRIHVLYFVNGVPIRRLDVNDSHRGLAPNTTHKHRYIPQSGAESVYVPEDIPSVPLGPTVALGTYRSVFEAFASECFVELPAGYWTEPGR